ncbi:helix-hairpin-helix domain-containing protein [Gracilibacillus thailandensis]|nr:helix-hairpin-helix domain-containing protein [Gracilibacillus thailandensis]
MNGTELLEREQGIIKVIKYKKDNFMIGILQKQNGEDITFKGNIFGIEKNEEIIFKGKWTEHIKYGKQFEVTKWERPIPKTKEKIISYLSSPFIKGCGEKQAIRIVNELGENAIEIIMKEKEEALLGIKGIGKKKAITIAHSVVQTYELQNIVSELSEYGIDPEFVIKVYKKKGAETLELLKRNPYELTKMKLISFPKVDEAEKKLVLIGQQAAMNIAIDNNKIVQRNTQLKERLDLMLIENKKKLLNI